MGAVIIVLAALLIGIYFAVWKKQNMPKVDPQSYQAVFLNNNQQYFGHLNNIETPYPYLTDIYYIQIQPGGNTATVPEGESKFTLIKLGNEIHGPQDVMYLNPQNILFWENLRADGQVMQGITKEKAQSSRTQTQPIQNSTQTQPSEGMSPVYQKK